VAKDAGFFESFRIADDVLRQGVQGISDIITISGIINRDFADVKTTMAGMGHAVMARRCARAPIAPLKRRRRHGFSLARSGRHRRRARYPDQHYRSSSLKLSEVNEASSLIQSSAHEDANIIFGAVLDEKMGEEVKITVIATGFRDQSPERRSRMLSIGEVAVVEEPVMSVPVVAGKWMEEPAVPIVTKAAAPATFLSEEEDDMADAEDAGDSFFFGSSSAVTRTNPGASTGTAVAEPVVASAAAADFGAQFGARFETEAPALVTAVARPSLRR